MRLASSRILPMRSSLRTLSVGRIISIPIA
jgi:hypothetical protein